MNKEQNFPLEEVKKGPDSDSVYRTRFSYVSGLPSYLIHGIHLIPADPATVANTTLYDALFGEDDIDKKFEDADMESHFRFGEIVKDSVFLRGGLQFAVHDYAVFHSRTEGEDAEYFFPVLKTNAGNLFLQMFGWMPSTASDGVVKCEGTFVQELKEIRSSLINNSTKTCEDGLRAYLRACAEHHDRNQVVEVTCKSCADTKGTKTIVEFNWVDASPEVVCRLGYNHDEVWRLINA